MNYRGKLLDGTTFDSNIDSAFNHMTPFEFPLGVNRVIRGWDEGVALLPLGSKATFYIPSRLGYAAQAVPGNPNNPKGIPANSILIFDVELTNIKPLNK
ncbi:MAG: FKBP-type peptidyl-prolyl cis-trans isomerase [Bacteroidetes bacterium]|nr:FKBP-type peptidyl-prolyl cis-trans isomerase [Bacteroidota bacterium]